VAGYIGGLFLFIGRRLNPGVFHVF
jgi:hypothetical protein